MVPKAPEGIYLMETPATFFSPQIFLELGSSLSKLRDPSQMERLILDMILDMHNSEEVVPSQCAQKWQASVSEKCPCHFEAPL